MSTNIPEEQLPLSAEKQTAVLGWLITDDKFFQQCRNIVQPSWFVDIHAGKIWDARVRFFTAYNRPPTFQELMGSEDFRKETTQTQNTMRVKAQEARNYTTVYGKDALIAEMSSWFHSRLFHEGFHAAETHFNKGEFEEAYRVMEEKLKEIRTTTFNEIPRFNFENYVQFFESRNLEVTNALTLGNAHLDRLILPAADGRGSLIRGDTTLFLAPTNTGKTTTLITVALANVRAYKDVLFITHEGSEGDIVEKIWCNQLNCNRADLRDRLKTPEGHENFVLGLKQLERFLTYTAMNRPGLTVEEVASAIAREQQDRIAKHGKGYDLVVCDYPAKLTSENMKHGQFQRRNVDDWVYNYFVQLALEHNFHFLGAVQTNRTGAKINKRQRGFEERLLVPEDANEAYGPMQTATNVITINRDAVSEQFGFVTFYVGKTRSSEKGWACVCKSQYAHAITHSDELGATWYRGTVPLGDQVQVLFQMHRNREIPNALAALSDASASTNLAAQPR